METHQLHSYNATFAHYMFKMTISESRTGLWHGRIGSTFSGRKQSSARLGKPFVRKYIQILNARYLQVRNIKQWNLELSRRYFIRFVILLNMTARKFQDRSQEFEGRHFSSGYAELISWKRRGHISPKRCLIYQRARCHNTEGSIFTENERRPVP